MCNNQNLKGKIVTEELDLKSLSSVLAPQTHGQQRDQKRSNDISLKYVTEIYKHT